MVWGTGSPAANSMQRRHGRCLRAFAGLPDAQFDALLTAETPPLVNVGCGTDVSIAELAELVKNTVGFGGALSYDTSKPDGTPRKLLDISKLENMGWRATTDLKEGLAIAYNDFLAAQLH